MKVLISSFFWQVVLLLLLLRNDINDGEKYLFRMQQWTASDIFFLIFAINLFRFIQFLIQDHHLLILNDYVFHIFLTILLVLFLRYKKTNIKIFGWKELKKSISVGILAGSGFYLFYLTLYLFVLTNSSMQDIAESFIGKLSLSKKLFYIFSYLLWGPFIEECIYRGILFSPYRKKYGASIAIIITAVFFSLAHFELSINLILGGVVLGILYERYQSILVPIITHGVYNIATLIGSLIFVLKS